MLHQTSAIAEVFFLYIRLPSAKQGVEPGEGVNEATVWPQSRADRGPSRPERRLPYAPPEPQQKLRFFVFKLHRIFKNTSRHEMPGGLFYRFLLSAHSFNLHPNPRYRHGRSIRRSHQARCPSHRIRILCSFPYGLRSWRQQRSNTD